MKAQPVLRFNCDEAIEVLELILEFEQSQVGATRQEET